MKPEERDTKEYEKWKRNNPILAEIWETLVWADKQKVDILIVYNKLKKIFNSLVSENVVGVTFSDGEFVPIEDESIMQWIAEQLDQKE